MKPHKISGHRPHFISNELKISAVYLDKQMARIVFFSTNRWRNFGVKILVKSLLKSLFSVSLHFIKVHWQLPPAFTSTITEVPQLDEIVFDGEVLSLYSKFRNRILMAYELLSFENVVAEN